MSAVALTVGIPTWNRAGHLATAVESVMEQAGADEIELLISDNASDDATPAVIERLRTKYPQLRSQRLPANCGGEGNIASIAEVASGEYVWLLGDDDIMMSGALRLALDGIAAKKAAFYYCPDNFFKGRIPADSGTMLELATKYGWLNLLGFISGCMIETRRLLAAVQGPRWELYCENTFPHACAFLEQAVDAPMVIFGRSMVATQDAQQTRDTELRWIAARTIQRLPFVGDSLSRMHADGLLPLVETGFFGYHDVTLWAKIVGDATVWQQRGKLDLSTSPDLWRCLHAMADLLRDRRAADALHGQLYDFDSALEAERSARELYALAGRKIETIYGELCRREGAPLKAAA